MQNYPNLSVDLSNCDNEPIHIIGRIQPHGFLIILNRHTLEVEQASDNIHQFLDADAKALTGKTLESITTGNEYDSLLLLLGNNNSQYAHILQLQGRKFFAFLHLSEGSLVLECESFEHGTNDEKRLEVISTYSKLQIDLEAADSPEIQSQLVVDFVQRLLDYDRVMLYRFDENWNGEVIAEKVKPGIHSYLYHHFPATDIPAQARALLALKPIRQIANAAGTAVNIVPYINPTTGKPSNIIESELRNPSEIHLEYLRNMDVQATLSISVQMKGKLWGIIACQHQTPVFINYWRRQLCRNVAQAYANALISKQEMRDVSLLEHKKQQEEQLLRQVLKSGSISEGLFSEDLNLLHLTEATGAALYLDNQLYTKGITPTHEQLQDLLQWITENVQSRVFSTRALAALYPAAAAYISQASGLLVLEISKFKRDYILYFKPEIQESRIWAGNPEKPVVTDSVRIYPRKSFNKWTELVKGKSQPWSVNEEEITQHLLKDMVSVLLKNQTDALTGLNNELKKTTNALSSKNKRLEEFAHIISHNLRSPLSNMQGLCNLYTTKGEVAHRTDIIEMMQTMIRNMAATIDDLNLILKSESELGLEWQQIDLQEIIEKELQTMKPLILQTNATFTTDLAVTTITAPKVYMESILHNLLSNALKYRSPERAPVVQVSTWQERDTIWLQVSDNGLGMNLDKVGGRLFAMYATFHRNKEAKGLGLYLTKMQIEALGGAINVASAPDKGTTFIVSLPVAK
ncbi:ATP-binding protein [Pontibacter burrus]|uniref:histidine kinase n=1 Tax=Pontibacter burrus TaxID=2704466 RepID=A0A6B3LT77_9BACT|nr:ATP-binding protein [Pontibacter burrus]NEM99023.1 GAF domain-containing protein [Pontibacter burrus]